MIEIDVNSRSVKIPDSEKIFGVTSDDKSEIKQFKMERFTDDGIDLQMYTLRVNYRNAKGELGQYQINDAEANDEGIITFSWTIDRHAAKYKGTLSFIICGILVGSDGKIVSEWNSAIGTGTVLEGLELEKVLSNY